jgi:hypothetical protein
MIISVLFAFWWKRICIAFIVYFYKTIKYRVQAVVVVRTLILCLRNVIWLRTNEQRVYRIFFVCTCEYGFPTVFISLLVCRGFNLTFSAFVLCIIL